ncbi:MAG TPA: diheme cytochrome c-553 [Mucilaginibacter sp.]|jgi:mono/diheme cytochrome c family protein|nr:diheme cytochrome c-553 [Mucilaginibacter sp.]
MKALIPILLIACLMGALIACSPAKSDPQTASAAPTKDSLVKRGAYLVAVMGCNDCHSPKKMTAMGPVVDSARMLSGFPANAPAPSPGPSDIKGGLVVFNGDLTACVGPWGTSFSANISSDDSGIGKWKEEQFDQALRHGKYKGLDGTRPLMPPMPWQDFSNLNDSDVKAIFYYLKSTKPVNNVVPVFKPAGKI